MITLAVAVLVGWQSVLVRDIVRWEARVARTDVSPVVSDIQTDNGDRSPISSTASSRSAAAR